MRTLRESLSLLALARLVYGDALPYNPTRILSHPNSSYVYIFQASSPSVGQAQLLALDISQSFTSATSAWTTVSNTLPFLSDNELLPYTPTVDASGNITVVAGECSSQASTAQVWQFQPALDSLIVSGKWTQQKTAFQEVGSDMGGYSGSSFLSNSISFSNILSADGADSSIYVFAGMCPFENSTADTWVSAAEYSNSMLTVSPDISSYNIGLLASRGPPVSQAGSSITPLPPTFGLNTSGTVQTQQQDFVLLGGNTQEAFINMSQVALFSMPQQSWSFVEVLQPTSEKTDLTVRRSVDEVTPRSGHTAVLSEDGTKIIVFGGWVGDVNTPAIPQLAVIELGAGYGGSGDWQWTIPKQSGAGVAASSGIYGHGATMLPGGVMMVLGGYEISGSSSRRTKRATQPVNSRTLLFNTTSNSWLQSYNPPETAHSQSGPLSSTSQKVGLGTGLGIGAALLVTMVGFYVWYGRRLKQTRDDRERALLTCSSDGSMMGQLDQPFLNRGMDGRAGDETAAGRLWPGSGSSGDAYPQPPPMHHSTGAWINVPSPTRGLRKPVPGKNYQYHAAPRYDENRLSRGSGNIHPIAEHENEDGHEAYPGSDPHDGLSDAEKRLREVERVLNSEDPFTEAEPNPLRSHPVSPIAGDTVRRVPTNISRLASPPASYGESGAPNWTVENNAKGSLLEEEEGGSAMVNGDDRTSSNLSDNSQRSANSNSSITRTMSTRTGAVLAAAAAASRFATGPQTSLAHERSNTMSTNDSYKSFTPSKVRGRSSTNGSMPGETPYSPGGDGDSFVSARSNLMQAGSEGDALLVGRPVFDADDPYRRAAVAQGPVRGKPLYSYSNTIEPPPIPPRRRPNLMGSLRRAFKVVSMSVGDRSVSLTGTMEQYEDGIRTSSSSPTKDRTGRNGNGPRRAVSDGGALLHQKRGQKDWNGEGWIPYRDDPHAGDWGEPRSSADIRQAEEDWDVEGAATNRDIQVMFTVPKSRLRVVNDDMDRASLRSASDGALSRNGSLRRAESIKPLKVRKEGEIPRLQSMEEELVELEKEKES